MDRDTSVSEIVFTKEKNYFNLRSKRVIVGPLIGQLRRIMPDPDKKTPRAEYIVLGVLFLGALLAFPAFRDVQMLQDFVISICSGLGLT